jgi:hypothetical protein
MTQLPCYLDGRYFNIVLGAIPGTITVPINIHLIHDYNKHITAYQIHMELCNLDMTVPYNYIRVITTTHDQRHSSLLILSYKDKMVYLYDPVPNNSFITAIVKAIKELLPTFEVSHIPFDNNDYNVIVEGCDKYGYCMAYVIKYVLDLNKYDVPQEVHDFTKFIINNYGPLEGEPDISYDLSPVAQGAIFGGLTGAAVGGLATGSVGGALIGGGVGALGGAAIGSFFR